MRAKRAVLFLSLSFLFVLLTSGASFAGKPTVMEPCLSCHPAQTDVVRGTVVAVSEKFSTIQLAVGRLVWVVPFDEKTTVKGAASVSELKKDKEIAVKFTGDEMKPLAVSVSVKPPAEIPAEKLAVTEDVAKLIASGDKGFVLIDSRPGPKYNEGHIPGAVSMPLPAFDKLKDALLPADKNGLVVMYCAGPTWRLSPEAARRAEKLGYANVKVYRDGLPAWKQAGNVVVSEADYIKLMDEKGISYVLIDLRKTGDAEKGFIKGAVSVPSGELASKKDAFPADKAAPIILYADETAGADAYKTVRGWGYKNASVLNGGLKGWTDKGGQLEKGKPGSAIAYAPKPRADVISAEEFKAVVSAKPVDKIVLDVRDKVETESGMLPGAVNIPSGDLEGRLSELPKDKEIIVHCVTGMRAEAAREVLAKNGFKSRFLDAVIQIDKDGHFEITTK